MNRSDEVLSMRPDIKLMVVVAIENIVHASTFSGLRKYLLHIGPIAESLLTEMTQPLVVDNCLVEEEQKGQVEAEHEHQGEPNCFVGFETKKIVAVLNELQGEDGYETTKNNESYHYLAHDDEGMSACEKVGKLASHGSVVS